MVYFLLLLSFKVPKLGDLFTEKELYENFNVRNNGGIRPSNKNKIIILIDSFFSVNVGQGNYQNAIDEKNGIIHYIGEGSKDQQMTRNNKSVLESKDKGFRIFYFIKPSQNNIVFKFEVEYDSYSHAMQKNSEGISRKIIKFKLKIV